MSVALNVAKTAPGMSEATVGLATRLVEMGLADDEFRLGVINAAACLIGHTSPDPAEACRRFTATVERNAAHARAARAKAEGH